MTEHIEISILSCVINYCILGYVMVVFKRLFCDSVGFLVRLALLILFSVGFLCLAGERPVLVSFAAASFLLCSVAHWLRLLLGYGTQSLSFLALLHGGCTSVCCYIMTVPLSFAGQWVYFKFLLDNECPTDLCWIVIDLLIFSAQWLSLCILWTNTILLDSDCSNLCWTRIALLLFFG